MLTGLEIQDLSLSKCNLYYRLNELNLQNI